MNVSEVLRYISFALFFPARYTIERYLIYADIYFILLQSPHSPPSIWHTYLTARRKVNALLFSRVLLHTTRANV